MWRTLPSRLRDWLDRLLEEHKAREASVVDAANVQVQNQSEVESGSTRKENADIFSWNTIQQPAPPEHWLKFVRGGAAELLRSLEEGEVPSSSAEEMFENDNPKAETPAADLFASAERPTPVAKERPSKITDSLSEAAASGMTSLRQALYRRLRPTAITKGKKDWAARKGSGETHLEPAHEGTQICPEPAAANPAKQVRAHQAAATKSGPSSLPAMHDVAPLSSWNKLVQKVRVLFPNAVTNPAISKEHAEGKKEEAVVFPKKEKPSRRFDEAIDHAASPSPRSFVSFEWPSVNGGLNPGAAQSQKRSRSVSTMSSNTSSWVPLPMNAIPLRDRRTKNARLGTTWGENPSISLPALQGVDPYSLDSARWPDPEEIDPWPELPEGPRLSEPNWRESLRSSDHLRALDLEQKGGR